MHVEGRIVRLRAVEPDDAELLYAWENDPAVWSVSGTTAPFSRAQMLDFIERQQSADIVRTGELRLMIETVAEGRTVGAADLFDYDPLNGRAGVGILIYGAGDRGRGYASDAVETLCHYGRDVLRLHQLWCDVGADNAASLALFRRAGFVAAGVRRDWLWRPDGGYCDEVMMQRLL